MAYSAQKNPSTQPWFQTHPIDLQTIRVPTRLQPWDVLSWSAVDGVAPGHLEGRYFCFLRTLDVVKRHSKHGSLNVPIEHHPTVRYMVYNGYYKVMSNIPKMGHLTTPGKHRFSNKNLMILMYMTGWGKKSLVSWNWWPQVISSYHPSD